MAPSTVVPATTGAAERPHQDERRHRRGTHEAPDLACGGGDSVTCGPRGDGEDLCRIDERRRVGPQLANTYVKPNTTMNNATLVVAAGSAHSAKNPAATPRTADDLHRSPSESVDRERRRELKQRREHGQVDRAFGRVQIGRL